MDQVVIVGGGLAGAQTAVALRERGYQGRLTLLAAERHKPYDRPPLSKELLTGARADSELEVDWDALGVDLRLGVPATGLAAGVVRTTAGPIGFDALVVATGARPLRLPAAGGREKDDGVRVLRTVEDAQAIRAALTPGARIVLVGAGWIGAEVATAATGAGASVTVVEAASAPLAGALPAEVAAPMAAWHAEAGVNLLLNAPVRAARPDGVLLADGTSVPADLVVVGVGVRPDTGWLAGSGLALDERGAVVADAGLRASVPGVYAAGDVVAYHSNRLGRLAHVQHWDNALRAGATIAANLLGGDEVYDPAPYFWSEQFGRMVQHCGTHQGADTVVWRGDPATADWSVCWLRDGALIGLLAVDRPREASQARRLIERATPMDPDRLADERTQLKAAAR